MNQYFNLNGQEFFVRGPTAAEASTGQRICDAVLAEGVAAGKIRNADVTHHLIAAGDWDANKDVELARLDEKLRLRLGQFRVCKDKVAATRLRDLRCQRVELLKPWIALSQTTAESFAVNARFDYLVTVCLRYADTGEPVYADVAAYHNHATDKVACEGAGRLYELLTGLPLEMPETAIIA
jgi:hypothetical protein